MEARALLHVLAHELRWRMVGELLESDLKVGELTAATGEAQNLVSYHLRLLRDAGVVRERRGSADGRDVYYALDRRAVTEGLLGALATMNPGRGAPPNTSPANSRPVSVLFVCTGNSARSQIAEAMLRHLGGRRVVVRSAGTHPAGVHPQVRAVLAAQHIRTGTLRSKSIEEFSTHPFDYVVSLCDIARAQQMRLPGSPRLVHWSIADPAAARGGRAGVEAAFERVTEEIKARVEDFYADLRARGPAAYQLGAST